MNHSPSAGEPRIGAIAILIVGLTFAALAGEILNLQATEVRPAYNGGVGVGSC